MRTLLKDVDTVISCDGADRVYRNTDVWFRDGLIERIGPQDQVADQAFDCSGMLLYPGFVNTHHHLYQYFTRSLSKVQGMELFEWLKTLYEIWKNLNGDTVFFSSLAAMGELMRYGCTTCFDHHYVFPQGAGDLIARQMAAADELGIRFLASRGSMDLSKKDGGLPPDSVVQTIDEIMADSRRLIETWHHPDKDHMHDIVLAPCSPFSVSGDLMRESAQLARAYGVRLHTHVGETRDEEKYTLARFGMRPVAYMESLGWVGPDVWYAHGIHMNDQELDLLAATGTGVAHCPNSNMKLHSGVCRVPDMLRRGVKVGLAVDGSASNDGSNMMDEIRRRPPGPQGHRLHRGREAGGLLPHPKGAAGPPLRGAGPPGPVRERRLPQALRPGLCERKTDGPGRADPDRGRGSAVPGGAAGDRAPFGLRQQPLVTRSQDVHNMLNEP